VATRRIFFSIVSFLLIGKLIGFSKDLFFVNKIGYSRFVDQHIFVFNYFQWTVSFFYSVLNMVYVPSLARLKDEIQLKLRLNQLFTFSLCYSLISTLVISLYLAHTFDYQSTVLSQLILLGGFTILLNISSVYSIYLMSRSNHINSLLEATPSAILLFGLILISPEYTIDLKLIGVCLFLLIGGVFQFFLIRKFSPIGILKISDPFKVISEIDPLVVFGVLALLLMSIVGLIDQSFLLYSEENELTAFSIASKFVGVPLAITTMALSRMSLPILSADTNKFKLTIVYKLLGLGTIIFCLAYLLGPIFLDIILCRLNVAFDHNLLTQRAFLALSFQLIPILAYTFVIQKIYVIADYKTLFMNGLVFILTKLGVIVLFHTDTIVSVPISSASAYFVSLIHLILSLWKRDFPKLLH